MWIMNICWFPPGLVNWTMTSERCSASILWTRLQGRTSFFQQICPHLVFSQWCCRTLWNTSAQNMIHNRFLLIKPSSGGHPGPIRTDTFHQRTKGIRTTPGLFAVTLKEQVASKQSVPLKQEPVESLWLKLLPPTMKTLSSHFSRWCRIRITWTWSASLTWPQSMMGS